MFTSFSTVREAISAQTTLARLLEGINFRYYWATEGLLENDYIYSPGMDTMSLNEINLHILDLAIWTHVALDTTFNIEKETQFPKVRTQIIDIIKHSQDVLKKMTITDLKHVQIRNLPFWNMINGPWADILTHIGQINTYRRLNGNPAPNKYSPFDGAKRK